MKLRSNCKCECHKNEHFFLHKEPCCIENPTIKEGWEVIKDSLIKQGIPESSLGLFETVFYLGAAKVIIDIDLIKALDTVNALQMVNDLSKESNEFIKNLQ